MRQGAAILPCNMLRIGACSSYFPTAFDPFKMPDVSIWQISETDPELAAHQKSWFSRSNSRRFILEVHQLECKEQLVSASNGWLVQRCCSNVLSAFQIYQVMFKQHPLAAEAAKISSADWVWDEVAWRAFQN